MLCAYFEYLASVVAEPEPEPKTKLAITASSDCPSRSDVIAALKRLIDIEIVENDPAALSLVVSSDASSDRVEIAGEIKVYPSTASCGDRVQAVANFAVDVLDPPSLSKRARGARGPTVLDPPSISKDAPGAIRPTVEVASDARHVTTPVRRTRALVFQLDAGGVLEAAPGASADRVNAGVDLRLALGSPAVQVVIGGAIVAPMTLAMADAQAAVRRVPIDLAVRGRWAGNAIAAAVEIGPRFTLQTSEGVNVMDSVRAVRLETGLRIAPRVELRFTRRYAAYLQVQGEYVPRPSRFTLHDMGEVGRMPSWWAGASLGLAVQIE
jgi:hypothetical protein